MKVEFREEWGGKSNEGRREFRRELKVKVESSEEEWADWLPGFLRCVVQRALGSARRKRRRATSVGITVLRFGEARRGGRPGRKTGDYGTRPLGDRRCRGRKTEWGRLHQGWVSTGRIGG